MNPYSSSSYNNDSHRVRTHATRRAPGSKPYSDDEDDDAMEMVPLFEIREIEERRRVLKLRFMDRDSEMDMVSMVRRGNIDRLFPDMFSDDLSKSVVANMVDYVARDLAEVMAPLPNLACSSGNMRTDVERRRAALKNKIGYYYWRCSGLEQQMFQFADSYNTHGFAVLVVEPDMREYEPKIRVENPVGVYYSKDRFGRVTSYVKETQATASELASMFPEHAGQILSIGEGRRLREGSTLMTLVRWSDPCCTVVYLPEAQNCVLAYSANPISRIPVAIVERFDLDAVPRGQFNDVIYVQLAKSIMALYQLQAADKAINAPIAVPDDVTEMALGPDSVMRTNNPQAIQRIRLDVPRDSYMLSEQLDKEAKEGARYPDARTGGVKGSIITGRGVEAMLGTFDTQIKTAQTLFKVALELTISLCFELDVALWPNRRKTINGTMSGKSFEVIYIPSRDIGDNFECSTTYGFASGMTPSQAIVTLLQLRGDKLIQRDTFRRALPFDVDPDEEQRGLDVEDMEEGLKQGLLALMQGIGPIASQGGDAHQILMQASAAIMARQKGKPLHQAITEAFTPPPPPEPPEGEAPPEMGPDGQPVGPEGAGPPGLPPGMRPNGLPQGTAPGQAGMGPGGMPSILSLIAEMKGAKGSTPNLQAGIMRKIPTGP